MTGILEAGRISSPPKTSKISIPAQLSQPVFTVEIASSPKVTKKVGTESSPGEWALGAIFMIQWALVAAMVAMHFVR